MCFIYKFRISVVEHIMNKISLSSAANGNDVKSKIWYQLNRHKFDTLGEPKASVVAATIWTDKKNDTFTASSTRDIR